jgi:hypothetical protein
VEHPAGERPPKGRSLPEYRFTCRKLSRQAANRLCVVIPQSQGPSLAGVAYSLPPA